MIPIFTRGILHHGARRLCDSTSREIGGKYGWWPALQGEQSRNSLRTLAYIASIGGGLLVCFGPSSSPSDHKHVFSPVSTKMKNSCLKF
jgi:hypothetical protein